MKILHVDDHVIAVDKPAGLLAVPGRGDAGRDCLATRVQAIYPDALVVHRLDMSTSGVMLMARGTAMQRALGRAFAAREIGKHYLAIVNGLVDADEGRIDLPLAADWPNRPRQKVDAAGGKPSLTRWSVLSRDADRRTTRLALEPLTGRSHQLRVHLQAIGHAIVGDALYAEPAVVAMSPRLMLHAHRIEWRHPFTFEPLVAISDSPF